MTLGCCYMSLGQYAKAVTLLEKARKLLEKAGESGAAKAGNAEETDYSPHDTAHPSNAHLSQHCTAHGDACTALGNCYISLGEHKKAAIMYGQGRKCMEEVGDRAGQGKTCAVLGNCYMSLGQYDKAMKMYEQARATAEEVGDIADEARALMNLGSR